MSKTTLWVFLAVFLILLAAVLLWFLLRARDIDGPRLIERYGESDENPVLLIDYCVKTLATVNGDGYRETVLYQWKDGACEVHYYSKYEGDEEETHRGFSVDSAVLEEAYRIISKNRISVWKDRRYAPGPDGTQYILKFRTEDGTYIRVSSDNMPEDGQAILAQVKACLDRYALEENLLP